LWHKVSDDVNEAEVPVAALEGGVGYRLLATAQPQQLAAAVAGQRRKEGHGTQFRALRQVRALQPERVTVRA
jgi:hypothetical protein